MNLENEKLIQYKNLIQARNRFFIGLIGLLVIMTLLYNTLTSFSSQQGLAVVLTMIFGILGFIFVVFGFLMKDICPWCKQNFFFQAGDHAQFKSFNLFFQKQCRHCHEPKPVEVGKAREF